MKALFQSVASALILAIAGLAGAEPVLPGVGATIQSAIEGKEVAGGVTMVVTKDKTLHLEATGMADAAAGKAMATDNVFWIASMTKPITGTALLMLQDEGKLNVADPVEKYIPEFAALKTPSGKPARLTIAQIMTHTSGMGDISSTDSMKAHVLADLIPMFLATPMKSEPGTVWSYCQSGINTGARIVEIASGMPFDVFVKERIFDPLGMKDSGFRMTDELAPRVATAYAKNRASGELTAAPPRRDIGGADRPPFGNGGLFSTAPDYARFCQMLLGGGEFEGKRLLSPAAMKLLSTVQTGDLPTGFMQAANQGSRGANYGWGIGTCIVKAPHEGVASMLSPGTFGHGGAWGTQAWVDPVRGVAYIMMVQRTNFPNSDNSGLRAAFQQAAADALPK